MIVGRVMMMSRVRVEQRERLVGQALGTNLQFEESVAGGHEARRNQRTNGECQQRKGRQQ